MIKRVLAVIITTVILVASVFLLAMIGVWLAWYTIKIAVYAAIGVALFSLIVFLLRGAGKRA